MVSRGAVVRCAPGCATWLLRFTAEPFPHSVVQVPRGLVITAVAWVPQQEVPRRATFAVMSPLDLRLGKSSPGLFGSCYSLPRRLGSCLDCLGC